MCSGRPLGRDAEEALGERHVGGQRVDADAVRRQLEGGRLGEVDDAGLGGRVGGVAGRGAGALDGGDVDDAAAAAVLDHRPGHPLRAQQHVTEVRADQRVPAVGRRLEQRRPEHAARVVDEDRHGPERARWCGRARRRPGRRHARRSGTTARRPRRRPPRRCPRRCSHTATRAPNAASPLAMPRPMPEPAAGDDRDLSGQQRRRSAPAPRSGPYTPDQRKRERTLGRAAADLVDRLGPA